MSDLFDSLRTVKFSACRPDLWPGPLVTEPAGLHPPYGKPFVRTLSCQACGSRMIYSRKDMACENVDCIYAHGWIAELRRPVDGEWTD